jgi:hypothetical protein
MDGMARTFSDRGAVVTRYAAIGFLVVAAGFGVRSGTAAAVSGPVCRSFAGPDPFEVTLVPTAHANGARGRVDLRFAPSPFGVTVSPDGHHRYDALVETTGVRPDGRALVVWAATPDLDRVQKLGTLDSAGRLAARIAFNKFLVFVTAEASADVERWAGPILLRGISPSGRMHTMAGHGPFQGEPCAKWGFGPGDQP